MKKGKLKKIPYLEADEKDREFLRQKGYPYLAKPERIVVDGQKVLLLNIYRQKQLQEGVMLPAYRVFEGKKEFLTEKTDSKTWTVCTLRDLINDSVLEPNILIRKKGEENIVKRFFREGNTQKRAIDILHGEQAKIKERERLQRRRKKEKKNKRLFAEVKPFSPAFLDWLDDQAMYSSQYIFYDYSRKKQIPCVCTHCRSEFELDRSIPRHNQIGTCPVCKRPACFQSRGRRRNGRIIDAGEAVKLERIGKGILIRHMSLTKAYKVYDPKTWKTRAYEDYRAILQEDGSVRYFDRDYFGSQDQWKQVYPTEYFYYSYHMPATVRTFECRKNMPGVLYRRNLKKCLSGTVFQYSGLALYAGKHRHEAIATKRYLETYLRFPQLEYFVKMGLYQISDELLWSRNSTCMDLRAKGLKETLKISKEDIRILRKYDLGSKYVEFFQKLQAYRISLDETEKKNFMSIYGMHDALLRKGALLEISSLASIRKITSYFAKQLERSGVCRGYRLNCELPELSERERSLYKNIAKDWLDYIGWAEALKHDIGSRAVLFPKELEKAHDRLYQEYQEFQEKEERKKLRKMRNTVNQMLQEERTQLGGPIENGDYLFTVPERWQDLRTEGDALGHCVGSYVKHIAKKHCSVYFIRKKAEPERPFYTVELQNGKVVQCQGKSRCAPTEKVSDFLRYATKKLQELKADEKRAA